MKDFIRVFLAAESSDLPSLQHAQACCRAILQAVNEDVRRTEHRQRLVQYQRRLDAAPQFKVTQRAHFVLAVFLEVHKEVRTCFVRLFSQSLDLTTKRMIHEGPLMWKISKDKQIGLYSWNGPH